MLNLSGTHATQFDRVLCIESNSSSLTIFIYFLSLFLSLNPLRSIVTLAFMRMP